MRQEQLLGARVADEGIHARERRADLVELTAIEEAERIGCVVRPYAVERFIHQTHTELRSQGRTRAVGDVQRECARLAGLHDGSIGLGRNGELSRYRRHAQTPLGAEQTIVFQERDADVGVADIVLGHRHLDRDSAAGTRNVVIGDVLVLLRDQHRRLERVALHHDSRHVAWLVRAFVCDQLEKPVAVVVDVSVLPRHPDRHGVDDLPAFGLRAESHAVAAGNLRRCRRPLRSPFCAGDDVALLQCHNRRLVVAVTVVHLFERRVHARIGDRHARIVYRACTSGHGFAGVVDVPVAGRDEHEASKGGHDRRRTGDLATAGVPDAGFHMRGVVLTVVVHAQRHRHLRFAAVVQSCSSFECRVASVAQEAVSRFLVSARLEPLRREVRLTMQHVGDRGARDRLTEVVASRNRQHRLAALALERGRRCHRHIELRLAVLLHLERARRCVVATRDSNGVVAEAGRQRDREGAVHRAEFVNGLLLADEHLVDAVDDGHFDWRVAERHESAVFAPTQHALVVHDVSWPIDGTIGIGVSHECARGLANRERARVRRGNLSLAISDGHEAVRLRHADLRLKGAVLDGRALSHGLLIRQHSNAAAIQRVAAEPVRGKDQQLARRRLRDEPDVRHDHDRVGAQGWIHGLDDVDARCLDVQRDASVLGVAHWRQQFTPRGDELRGIQQRDLREAVDVERLPEHDLLLVVLLVSHVSILGAELSSKEPAHLASSFGFPRGNPFQPRPLLFDDGFFAAEFVRIAQLLEEGKGVVDEVDAEVQMVHAAVRE